MSFLTNLKKVGKNTRINLTCYYQKYSNPTLLILYSMLELQLVLDLSIIKAIVRLFKTNSFDFVAFGFLIF